MKRCPPILIRGLGVALLTLTVAASAQADLRSWNKPAPVRHRPPTFDVSGVYTGTLYRQVVIDGMTYTLANSPVVYKVGVGRIELSELPIGSRVFASGQAVGSTGLVDLLIARPEEARAATSLEPSGAVRERTTPLEQ